MYKLSFGSFEKLLESYIVPKISQQDLGNILLLSPKIDVRDGNKDTLRSTYSVEKSTISKICSGKRGLPKNIRKYYSEPDAFAYMELCFSMDIAPRIPSVVRDVFLQEIFALIDQDETLPGEIKKSFTKYKIKSNEDMSDFLMGELLAKVYSCAIRSEDKALPARTVQKPNIINERPLYTLEEVEAGALDGIITFNSIINSTIGNEKNFVGAREYHGAGAGRKNIWNIGGIAAKHGMEYIVRLYVHGSNKYGTDSIASNVKVAFNVPTETSKRLTITGFIFANNAHPNKYYDSIVFTSDIPFHFEYVYGSALIENNGIGKNGGRQLSDEIVTKAASNNGTLIGYSQLDGCIPSSYQYASYISIRVKTVFDAPFLVKGKVRIAGSIDWEQSAKVKIGTMLEVYFKYQNIDEVKHDKVTIKCILPPSLHYVSGSTKIYNAECDGAVLDDGVTTTGLIIGNYTPGSDVYVCFTTEVVDDDLADGWNKLTIKGKYGVGQMICQGSIGITVRKPPKRN